MKSVKKLIIQSKSKILLAFNRRDAKGVAQNYFKEAKLFITSRDVVQGTEKIEAYWKTAMDKGIKIIQLETSGSGAFGATVLEVGKYKLSQKNGRLTIIGDYLAIWRKKDDELKLYFHQLSLEKRVENSSIQINKREIRHSYVASKIVKSNKCLYNFYIIKNLSNES